MTHHIIILGAGAIGQAIGKILSDAGKQPVFWDKQPDKVPNQPPLAELIPQATIIFLCVPSWFLVEAINEIRPHLKAETILISISKGLESATSQRTDQLFATIVPANPLCLLSGPMLASEIMAGQPSYAILASQSEEARTTVAQVFAGSTLRLTLSDQIEAIALAGVLKNVYAIALGMAAGSQVGHNTIGWLATRAIAEMEAVITALGFTGTVATSIAGLGDFIATGMSSSSSNHRLGAALVTAGEATIKSEGQVSLPPLITLLGDQASAFPLLTRVAAAIANPQTARATFQEMLSATDAAA